MVFLPKQIMRDGNEIVRFLILFFTKSKSFKVKRFRTTLNNFFIYAIIRSLLEFMSEFNAKGDILMEHLRLKADGKQVVTLLKEFNHAALDAIASV